VSSLAQQHGMEMSDTEYLEYLKDLLVGFKAEERQQAPYFDGRLLDRISRVEKQIQQLENDL